MKKFFKKSTIWILILGLALGSLMSFFIPEPKPVYAAIEERRPTDYTDSAGDTTNPTYAYDASTTTYSTTDYGGSPIAEPSITFHTWQTTVETYSSLVLKVLYSADAASNDLYKIQYSIDGGSSWTILVDWTSAGATDETAQATLSASQDLSLIRVRIDTDKVLGADGANLYIKEIWTEGDTGKLTISAPASTSLGGKTVSTASQNSTGTISYIEVSDTRAGSPGWSATIKSTHFTTIGSIQTVAGSNTITTGGTYDGTYGVTDPVKRYGVKIVDGGAVGTATYQWRVDDGAWSATATTSATVDLEKGIQVNFDEAVTYAANDEWVFGVDVFPYTDLYVTPSDITIVSGDTGVSKGTAGYLTGTGTTSDAKTIMTGDKGNSSGTYRQDEGLELTIHANSVAGTYSATATFTAL